MEFNLKQGSTLPEMIYEIEFNRTPLNYIDRIKNADITISIYQNDMCTPIIHCDTMNLIEYNSCNDGECKTYYLVYTPKKNLTRKKGIYYAQITITFLDTNDILILPTSNFIKITVN